MNWKSNRNEKGFLKCSDRLVNSVGDDQTVLSLIRVLSVCSDFSVITRGATIRLKAYCDIENPYCDIYSDTSCIYISLRYFSQFMTACAFTIHLPYKNSKTHLI